MSRGAYFDGHACAMESMGKQDSLAQHSMKSCGELDFGDGEGMAKMERAIHIRVREIPKPLWKLLPDLCGREAFSFLGSGSIDLEDACVLP